MHFPQFSLINGLSTYWSVTDHQEHGQNNGKEARQNIIFINCHFFAVLNFSRSLVACVTRQRMIFTIVPPLPFYIKISSRYECCLFLYTKTDFNTPYKVCWRVGCTCVMGAASYVLLWSTFLALYNLYYDVGYFYSIMHALLFTLFQAWVANIEGWQRAGTILVQLMLFENVLSKTLLLMTNSVIFSCGVSCQ